MDIEGKSALVTGGGSGIGRAISLALGNAGASVVVADVDQNGGKETVHQIEDAGGSAIFLKGDVSTPDGVRLMFESAGSLDIVCNNAGIMTGDTPGWPDVSLEKIHLVLSTNSAGVMMGTREAIAVFGDQGGKISAAKGGVVRGIGNELAAAEADVDRPRNDPRRGRHQLHDTDGAGGAHGVHFEKGFLAGDRKDERRLNSVDLRQVDCGIGVRNEMNALTRRPFADADGEINAFEAE